MSIFKHCDGMENIEMISFSEYVFMLRKLGMVELNEESVSVEGLKFILEGIYKVVILMLIVHEQRGF
jgi:hypothetical protein